MEGKLNAADVTFHERRPSGSVGSVRRLVNTAGYMDLECVTRAKANAPDAAPRRQDSAISR